jgi:hypothetical protein
VSSTLERRRGAPFLCHKPILGLSPHPAPYTPHSTIRTPHPTPYTLQLTRHILHTTPHTLHPTPHPPHPAPSTPPRTRTQKESGLGLRAPLFSAPGPCSVRFPPRKESVYHKESGLRICSCSGHGRPCLRMYATCRVRKTSLGAPS